MCFKDPSNDAHQAITAEQMAFFSTQFIYKRLGNEAILEVAHPGGGRRLAPVSFDPIHVLHSRGERVLCNEEAPRSGRGAFLPQFSRSWLGERELPEPVAAHLPGHCLPSPRGRPAHHAEGTGKPIPLPEMPPRNAGVPFQPEWNILKGPCSLCFISAETSFLLGDREKRLV